jgi:hypothetical protein
MNPVNLVGDCTGPRTERGFHVGRTERFVSMRVLTPLLLLTFSIPAFACRFNVREIGFVDAGQPKFRLAVFVHGDEQKEWLPVFQQSAGRILGPSNLTWDIVDEVQSPGSPDLRHRAQLGPRLPGGMVIAPGREDGWPIFLHFPAPELDNRLTDLVASPVRAQILSAAIETYGAVLLLRSQDESANTAARSLAGDAIKSTEATLADLPKRIALGPRLIECDPSLPGEQILAWSLGVNGRDLTQPVLAVIYGRGRLAGPALRGETLTIQKLRDQLALIGADCECIMDHAWMTAGALPLAVNPADEFRITDTLGFDPASASVRAEVLQILQNQSAIAADPARRGGGYRETPLEIVPIGPGLPPVAGTAAIAEPAERRGYWVPAAICGGVLLFILFILRIRKLRERSS